MKYGKSGYYLYDALGTTAAITNMNAGIIDNNRFAPFGEPLSPVAKNSRLTNSPWGYTGESHDIEVGLVYLRARYYEPVTGRFIQQDSYPYFGEIEEPLTRNLYIYGKGNPLNYTDPSGNQIQTEGDAYNSDYLSEDEFISIIQNINNFSEYLDIKGKYAYEYDPKNWGDEFEYNLEQIITIIPNNLPDSQRYPLIDIIILLVARNLQTKYGTVYYSGRNNPIRNITEPGTHQKLKPLFEAYPTVKNGNALISAFFKGFTSGLYMGIVDGAIIWKSSIATKGVNKGVDNFIKSNVPKDFQKNVKSAFINPRVTTLSDDVVVYRYYGDGASSVSYWVTPHATSNPVKDLALPLVNNATNVQKFIIPKGTTILEGVVAHNFGQVGGGYQYYISDPNVLIPIQ
jgi:RHS repeat-associated protein